MNIVIQLAAQSMVHYAAQFQIIIVRDHAILRPVGHIQLVYYVWLRFVSSRWSQICRDDRFS